MIDVAIITKNLETLEKDLAQYNAASTMGIEVCAYYNHYRRGVRFAVRDNDHNGIELDINQIKKLKEFLNGMEF